MSDKYALGTKIVLTRYLGHRQGLKNGDVGEVVAYSDYDLYIVNFDGVGNVPVYHRECANEDALPLLPGSPLDERLLQPAAPVEDSAFAQAAQGDDALAVALYEAAVLNTVVDELQGASVDAPLDGETFDEWVVRVGKAVEDTAFYWRRIAAANLELASVNGDLLENAQHELDNLRQQLADAQAGSEGNGGL